MTCCRHISAIFMKEWLYWRRNICWSIFELILPFGVMALVLYMYSLSDNETHGSGPNYDFGHRTFTAIGLDANHTTMGLINTGVLFYESELFNPMNEEAGQIGIAPNGNPVVKEMEEYFRGKKVRYKVFETEEDLIKCAENPFEEEYEDEMRLTNITIGISFTGSAKSKDYSYKLLLDKSHFNDISENFVDRLQKYYESSP